MPDFSDLMGKPFRVRGRGPEDYDCWGLVIEARNRFGLQTPDYDACFVEAEKIGRYSTIAKALAFEKVGTPQAGDIVEFRQINNHPNAHFAVMINAKEMLDITDDGAGVKPRRITSPLERHMIAGYWRDRK